MGNDGEIWGEDRRELQRADPRMETCFVLRLCPPPPLTPRDRALSWLGLARLARVTDAASCADLRCPEQVSPPALAALKAFAEGSEVLLQPAFEVARGFGASSCMCQHVSALKLGRAALELLSSCSPLRR